MAPSTVGFYERARLLSPARRAPNGYRVFDEAAIDELAFVNRAKGIGMNPVVVANLARLSAAETACCAQTRFVIEVSAEQVTLTAEAPRTPELLEALFPTAVGAGAPPRRPQPSTSSSLDRRIGRFSCAEITKERVEPRCSTGQCLVAPLGVYPRPEELDVE